MDSHRPRQETVLVTGGSGFIGRYAVNALAERGFGVNVADRTPRADAGERDQTITSFTVGSIDGNTDWTAPLQNCSAVVHLAGRAHRVHESASAGAEEFQRINVDATVNIAEQAWTAGVRRFVYISSIGVMGDTTIAPFDETDMPRPVTEYAKSKLRAENALRDLAERTGIELIILRPCLVYGPGNPGNLERLLKLIAKGIPLPFASICNARSLVSVQYLCAVIMRAVTVPVYDDGLYVVSDGVDVSTSQIIAAFARGLRISRPMFQCPPWILKGGSTLLGKRREFDRMFDDLRVDSSKMRHSLGVPPNTRVIEQLTEVGLWYHNHLKVSS